ncbi:hypothetical protein Pint_26297 [Pistacia integerrima]|uniref:Uncharacterized protein n=1 Tax=Pistacia integerrima TaxID=434235 RepID=A0ACC0YIT0_9ROSI|nr:hypothetical protein Pint_26297 [Pistacia integerrima]
MDFEWGWSMDPLVYGDYPKIMKEIVRDRLPSFTDEEKKMVLKNLMILSESILTQIAMLKTFQ